MLFEHNVFSCGELVSVAVSPLPENTFAGVHSAGGDERELLEYEAAKVISVPLLSHGKSSRELG